MLLTNDNIDFKKVNKNLKQELSKMGFDISNQSSLNLLSRSLGYNNYNTYKALSNEVFEEQGIKSETIFNILKNATGDDFYILSENEIKFVYNEDTNLTIEEDEFEEKEKIYGYNYFFDINGKEIELNDPYDKLIKKICEHKDFPETYNNIIKDKWTIKYNNIEIFTIHSVNVSNLSSLNVYLPLEINTFDFVYNLCTIVNDYSGANTTVFAVRDIEDTLNIKDSTFQDFLTYK